MQFEEFTLERIQSLYENTVRYNLSDSGVHPLKLQELFSPAQVADLANIELGYGWTNGAIELREMIAGLYKDRTADEVIVTNGSAEANFLVGATLVEPGDEVVVVTPNYLQLYGWAKAIGAVVRPVSLRPELGWRPDMEELAAAVGSKTKLITICTPNNPTGSLLSLDDMAAIVSIARHHGVWLHADEVYKGAELYEAERPSFADLYEKAIVTNGLSKAMALPGLRIGWLVGPAAEIATAWARKDYTSITTGALSEHIAGLVLQNDLRAWILDRSKRMLRENLEVLGGWIAKTEGFSMIPPEAGGMAFVAYEIPINSTALADRLRKEASVLVLPGDVYGLDGYIRLGIGATREHLEAGLDRIAALADSLVGRRVAVR